MRNIICGLFAITLFTQVASGSTEILSKKEQRNIVNFHNMYRNPLKLQKLTWSDSIATSAQNWAIMLENNECPLKHSPAELRNNYGENLYAGWSNNMSYKISIRDGVRSWAKEKAY
jgi:pathogenesis-related protein 1